MEKPTAQKILLETQSGYDLIAQKFSQTRKHFWRDLEFIGSDLRSGQRVLDFGCGNGRLAEFLRSKADVEYWGTDVSEELLKIAKEKLENPKIHFLQSDPLQITLPLESNFFNAIYSIAVFHHIPDRQIRQKLAQEFFRLAQKNSQIVVTVWNLWSISNCFGRKKYLKNIWQNWKNKILGKSELDWNDCQISFTDNQGRVFWRYHHAFTRREMQRLFEKAGFVTKKCQVLNGRNILYIGEKN